MQTETKIKKCGYLGPLGTYSYQAAHELFTKRNQTVAPDESIQFIPIDTIPALFSSSCDFIVSPIENSTSGVVSQTLNSLYSQSLNLKIYESESQREHERERVEQTKSFELKKDFYAFHAIDEISIAVNHCFMKSSKTDQNQIKKIYSHPEALAQCSLWLQDRYPNAQLIPVSSTAHGGFLASTDFESASISNYICADLYGLEILQDKLAPEANTTRFLLFLRVNMHLEDSFSSLSSFPKEGREYLTLLLHQPKADQDSLGLHPCSFFAPIHRIFSKPVPRSLNHGSSLWNYFYLYLIKGHESDEKVVECIKILKESSFIAHSLGSFQLK